MSSVSDLPACTHFAQQIRISTSKYAGTIFVHLQYSNLAARGSSVQPVEKQKKKNLTNHSAGFVLCLHPNIKRMILLLSLPFLMVKLAVWLVQAQMNFSKYVHFSGEISYIHKNVQIKNQVQRQVRWVSYTRPRYFFTGNGNMTPPCVEPEPENMAPTRLLSPAGSSS